MEFGSVNHFPCLICLYNTFILRKKKNTPQSCTHTNIHVQTKLVYSRVFLLLLTGIREKVIIRFLVMVTENSDTRKLEQWYIFACFCMLFHQFFSFNLILSTQYLKIFQQNISKKTLFVRGKKFKKWREKTEHGIMTRDIWWWGAWIFATPLREHRHTIHENSWKFQMCWNLNKLNNERIIPFIKWNWAYNVRTNVILSHLWNDIHRARTHRENVVCLGCVDFVVAKKIKTLVHDSCLLSMGDDVNWIIPYDCYCTECLSITHKVVCWPQFRVFPFPLGKNNCVETWFFCLECRITQLSRKVFSIIILISFIKLK